MRRLWSYLLAVSPLLLGCRDATGATQIVVGIIDAGQTLTDVIAGPVSGSAGVPLQFTVSTFGNSCISAAGAKAVVDGLLATVTPYDHECRGPLACLDYLKAYARSVSVVFDTVGDATVRVEGRSSYQAGLVTVEHHVRVVP